MAERRESKENADNPKSIDIDDPKPKYKTERPKPKKLIKRIDNPWVAKLKKQGQSQPRHLCRVMRQMPGAKTKIPRRIKKKISIVKGDMIIEEEPPSPVVEVEKRKLPPAPISKRALPGLPGGLRPKSLALNMSKSKKEQLKSKYNSATLNSLNSHNSTMGQMTKSMSVASYVDGIQTSNVTRNADGTTMVTTHTMIVGPQDMMNKQLSFEMNAAKMSFSYSPPPPMKSNEILKSEEQKQYEQKKQNLKSSSNGNEPPSLESIEYKKVSIGKEDEEELVIKDSDSEDSLLQKMEQTPDHIDSENENINQYELC